MKKSSILAYADELKSNVQSGVPETAVNEVTDEEEVGEESSGYVIDYEQVLKDNSQ